MHATQMDLTTRLAPQLLLANPVMASSGTFGFSTEYAALMNIDGLGGITSKGVSWDAWDGNPPPRIWETASGMLNSVGLQNPGVEAFCQEHLPRLQKLHTVVVANIVGKTAQEYGRVAQRLESEAGIAALELNISCPNVEEGGAAFGTDPMMAASVVRAVRAHTRRPIIVKLVPTVPDLGAIAQAVVAEGADVLSCGNALPALAIDVARRRPALGGIGAGLSGPAIKPVALREVWDVSHAVSVPVIGIGGVATARDVLEFLMAGACAVMVGTATFGNPQAMLEMIQALPLELSSAGFGSVAEAIRAAH